MHKEILDAIARERINQTQQEIEHTLKCVHQGIAYAAEDQIARREAGIERGLRVPAPIAKLHAKNMTNAPEAIQGKTIDFVPVSFMERGLIAARAVARIAFHDGRAQGTGFMCTPNLFITNNHVIQSPTQASLFRAQFNFETDLDGRHRPVTNFRFAPEKFFFTDGIDGLDVTIIAIGDRIGEGATLESFGWCGLSASSTKHSLGSQATIIQHPQGRHKEVVLRENLIAGRHELALHYLTDTEPGSSGSPVFNEDWRPIALHHWGGAHIAPSKKSYHPHTVNEGIRISAIVKKLNRMKHRFPSDQQLLVEELLLLGEIGFPESSTSNTTIPSHQRSSTPGPQAQLNESGHVTWTVPLEISVAMPFNTSFDNTTPQNTTVASDPTIKELATSQVNSESMIDFSDRGGYRPDFINGEIIPLPQMNESLQRKIARIPVEQIPPGGNDFELRYHHFSIVMNAERNLAFYTACNIDGGSLIGIKGEDQSFYDYNSKSVAFRESLGQEGGNWEKDPRLSSDEQTLEKYYESTPNKLVDAKGHTNLLEKPNFNRGHLVRRLTPAWGTEEMSLLAEKDTFFSTNAAPQMPNFNQGKATGLLGKEKGRLWQGIENYILRNAWSTKSKMTIFTGPVFKNDDPVYSDKLESINIQVPLRFWKVLVWQDEDTLKSLALIADQTPTIKNRRNRREALDNEKQLDLMSSFLTTVAKIETLTGLEFGDAVSQADIRFGRTNGNTGDAECFELYSENENRRTKQTIKKTARKKKSKGKK